MSDIIKNPVRDIIVPQVAESGGGGGEGLSAVRAGASGVDSNYTASSSNYATKSTIFTCTSNLSITRIAMKANVVSGATYTITIAEYSGGAIAAVLAVSSVFTAPATASEVWVDVPFSAPVELTSGTVYVIALSRTDGTGTTSLTWNVASAVLARTLSYNVPLSVGDGTNSLAFFAVTSLSVSDTPDVAIPDEGGVYAFSYTLP